MACRAGSGCRAMPAGGVRLGVARFSGPRLVHDGNDFDPLGKDPVVNGERKPAAQGAADGLPSTIWYDSGASEMRRKTRSISSSNEATTCGASREYHCSASARSCSAAVSAGPAGSRLVGKDSLAGRFPRCGTLVRPLGRPVTPGVHESDLAANPGSESPKAPGCPRAPPRVRCARGPED